MFHDAIALPRLSPGGGETPRFHYIYPRIVAAIAGLMLYLTIIGLVLATHSTEATPNRRFAGLGVFFIVIGNYMGKLTGNSFVGVRTPWTLASDGVRQKAHRFAGPEFVIAGMLLALAFLSACHRSTLCSRLPSYSIAMSYGVAHRNTPELADLQARSCTK